MSDDRKKSLNETSVVPEQLRGAYAAVADFSFPDGEAMLADPEFIKYMANQEAATDGLVADAQGVTPGLQSILRQTMAPLLAPWNKLLANFDTAIQPFRDQINAAESVEEKKRDIERKAEEAEQAVILQAEALRAYAESKLAKVQSSQHFEQLRQGAGGRPVNMFGDTKMYYVVLILITSVEWLINYDAFFEWTGNVVAIAAGFTIAMAAAVGFAAHVHGTYLKQRDSRFGAHSFTKGRDVAFLVIATSLLLLAVVVAGWARHSLAMSSIASQGPVINSEFAPTDVNPMTDVYFSLGINLIVWLIGVVVAFISHDEDYELMSAERERRIKTKLFMREHKPWEARIATIRAKAANELKQLGAATALAITSTKNHRDMLADVERRKESLYGALASRAQPVVELYRLALINELSAKGHGVIIEGKPHSPIQYRQRALALDADLLRDILK